MRVWRWLLLLIVLVLLAAGWTWVGGDPGRITVHVAGHTIEMALLTGLIAVVIAVMVLTGIWHILRWPFGAVSRRQRDVGHKRLVTGLVLLSEGHYAKAQQKLVKAAKYAPQKSAALLMAAQAAARYGDTVSAQRLLDKSARQTPLAARNEIARLLRHTGHADEALALLSPRARSGDLPPAGWLEVIKSALLSGQVKQAYDALTPLRKSGALDAQRQLKTEKHVLGEAIRTSPNAKSLNHVWRQLRRPQRRQTDIVVAYAQRAAELGQSMAAMGELEAALKRDWSPQLVKAWGTLPGANVQARLGRAESWMKKHPDDAALMATLGQLCIRLEIWGKARQYLNRALALEPDMATWEALGQVYAGQGHVTLSQRCYHNALRLQRNEPTQGLPSESTTVSPQVSSATGYTARNEQGMPHLTEDNKHDVKAGVGDEPEDHAALK